MGEKNVEQMVEEWKNKVCQALNEELTLKELYKLGKSLEILVKLEREVGGSEKEIKAFIEKLMKKTFLRPKKSRRPYMLWVPLLKKTLTEHLFEIAGKIKNNPILFAEKFLNFKPLTYQKRLLQDSSKRISVRWCRQSGKTTTFAVKMLWFATTHPYTTTVVIAPSLRQSRNVRDKLDPLLLAVPNPIRNLMFKKIQREQVFLRNGSKILFFPNSPDLIRGVTADMIFVDEFAFFREDRYLLNNVLQPMLSTRERFGTGYLYIASTPTNKNTMFYRVCQPEAGFSNHHVSWREVVKEGLISEAFIEQQKQLTLPSEFQMEYEAEFVEDADSWLPYDLISSCIDAFLEPYKFTDTPQGFFYIGVDLGKYQDYSAVAVIQRQGENLKLVHLHRFPLNTPYATVIGYIKTLSDRYSEVQTVLVDQTGVGEYVVEDMLNAGIPRVQGIKFTQPMKEEVMTFLKQKMLNKQVNIYYNETFIAELNVEKFEITKDGKLKFSHPTGTHDDMLWAFALAVYATKTEKKKETILF